jgi:hypothetical protein
VLTLAGSYSASQNYLSNQNLSNTSSSGIPCFLMIVCVALTTVSYNSGRGRFSRRNGITAGGALSVFQKLDEKLSVVGMMN